MALKVDVEVRLKLAENQVDNASKTNATTTTTTTTTAAAAAAATQAINNQSQATTKSQRSNFSERFSDVTRNYSDDSSSLDGSEVPIAAQRVGIVPTSRLQGNASFRLEKFGNSRSLEVGDDRQGDLNDLMQGLKSLLHLSKPISFNLDKQIISVLEDDETISQYDATNMESMRTLCEGSYRDELITDLNALRGRALNLYEELFPDDKQQRFEFDGLLGNRSGAEGLSFSSNRFNAYMQKHHNRLTRTFLESARGLVNGKRKLTEKGAKLRVKLDRLRKSLVTMTAEKKERKAQLENEYKMFSKGEMVGGRAENQIQAELNGVMFEIQGLEAIKLPVLQWLLVELEQPLQEGGDSMREILANDSINAQVIDKVCKDFNKFLFSMGGREASTYGQKKEVYALGALFFGKNERVEYLRFCDRNKVTATQTPKFERELLRTYLATESVIDETEWKPLVGKPLSGAHKLIPDSN